MQSVEMALDAALIVIQNGGSTIAANRSFNNILKGYKKEGVSATWRLDFISATTADEGRSATIVRSVGPIGVNLVRASEIQILGEKVAAGELNTISIADEIERIKKLHTPYNRWLAVLAAACIGAAMSQFAGGDTGSFGIAFIAAGIGQILRSILQARKLPVANITLICAFLSACIACYGIKMRYTESIPVTLIASVVYLAPGLPLINGFLDMISHKFLFIGMERMSNALFLFLVMAITIVLAHTLIL